MVDHKLDIFETLSAIDRREKDFFSGLSEDTQKGFAPPVVLRWASAVSDGANSERYMWLVNERANINFWDISDHPELQFKLLASCGIGRNQRHQWISMVTRKRKTDRVRTFLNEFWPDANDAELDILLSKFTNESFEEFVLSSGRTPEEIKEVLEAYDRLTGKTKPKGKKRVSSAQVKPIGFTCDYCKKSYQQEQTFLVHMCEPKRRWLDQDTKHVKLGFSVFKRFHEANYIGRKDKTFEDFIRSKFYAAFTRFGRYLLDLNAINPKGFIEFLIRTEVKLDKWQSAVVYETYVRELNKKETPDAAIERNFLLMQQWANDTGEPWTDFFRKISPALATQWIRSGRISPWILFTASSAKMLFDRLSEEQLALVQQNIDPDFWSIKLKRAKDDVDFIRDTLDEAGL